MKKFSFLICAFIGISIFAQTGPGGVGSTDGSSSLELWLMPSSMKDSDGNTPSNGETIQSWEDLSGNNSHAYYLNSSSPGSVGSASYSENYQNSYSSFNASNLNGNFRTNNNVDARTMIVANNPGSHSFIGGLIGYNSDFGIRRTKYNTNQWQTIGADEYNNDCWTSESGESYINGNGSINPNNNVNGIEHNQKFHIITQVRTTTSSTHNVNEKLYLGGYYTWSGQTRPLNGEISETIIFSHKITLAERTIVENYLSAKYDLELASNGNGFYKMDKSNFGDFDFDVAGIGQATDGSSHLHSRGTGIVEIQNPNSIVDKQFLFWGSNLKGVENYQFEYNSSSASYRLNNKWRADTRGPSGFTTFAPVDFSIHMSEVDMSALNTNCYSLRLIVSNNENFNNATKYNLIQNGNTWSAEDVQFNDQDYFTVEYNPIILWDGTAYRNGSGNNECPAMTDSCMKFLCDAQANTDTIAILSDNAEVKELEVKAGNTLVIEDSVVLYIEEGIQLDGDIRLLGDAQIIQNHNETSKVTGNGKLYRERKSLHPTKYTVQYISSPVSVTGTNKHDVTDVIHTGGIFNTATGVYEGITNNSTHNSHSYSTDPYGATDSPLTMSNYWFWKFRNGTVYTDWQFVRDASVEVFTGEGFSTKGTGRDEIYVFIGTPNDGNYSLNVTANTENLLGNPYPSAMDAHKFINDNLPIIEGTLHFWDHVSATSHDIEDYEGGYGYLNLSTAVAAVHISDSNTNLIGAKLPKKHLTVGQGFFVKTNNDGNIIFNNNQRIHKTEDNDESILLRNPIPSRLLKISMGHYKNEEKIGTRQIAIAFKEGLSTAHDNGYDSKMVDIHNTDFYWKFDNNENNYVIATVSKFHLDQEIPLVVKAEHSGKYLFKIDEKKAINAKVFLKDSYYGMSYELTEEPLEYIIDQGEHENRFSVIFKPLGHFNLGIENNPLENIQLFYAKDQKEIVVRTNQALEYISMFNLIGQKVLEQNISENKTEYRIPVKETISNGIYGVRIKTKNGEKSFKLKI
ncbi:T9SS type A sorting domain-containing protein [Aureivirga sp. CE67]|uniref:T9SS type A sorting domain-containing protein n=1 Tax=Aureivirga sp. CE67 TaxID=1788983 RepID=UPI0018CBD856|nr:T9SS type A sorting domain-containing protein [Aureivirga sp. CE67]